MPALRRSLKVVSACGLVALIGATLLLPACLRLRLGPDRGELGRFVAGARAAPPVTVTPLLIASGKQPRCGLAGEATCFRRIEMVHASYLVRHPRATFLIDAGVSRRTRADLRRFSLTTRLAFAYDTHHGLADVLAKAGNPPIDFVILTHAHWDHTGGLVDLPGVKVLASAEDIALVHDPGRGEPTGEPTIVPAHFAHATLEPISWDGPAYENFPRSHDLFGDGAVILVPLPGHTPGSLGLFVNNCGGRRVFFVGDAVWSRDGIRIPSHRPRPLSRVVDADANVASDTVWRLHHLQAHEPQLLIIPAHDGEALRDLAPPTTP